MISCKKELVDILNYGYNLYFGKKRQIAIGANSMVNKSFIEDDITIGGNPAHKLKEGGSKKWNNEENDS